MEETLRHVEKVSQIGIFRGPEDITGIHTDSFQLIWDDIQDSFRIAQHHQHRPASTRFYVWPICGHLNPIWLAFGCNTLHTNSDHEGCWQQKSCLYTLSLYLHSWEGA